MLSGRAETGATMDETRTIFSSACHHLIAVCATIAFSFLLILSLPLALVFAIHYTIAILSASKFRPELTIVGGADAWFATEPVYTHPHTTIIWHLICEGSVTVQELRRKFRERVLEHRDSKGGLVYRRLRQNWTRFLGYFFWEWDQNFDINHHVRLYDYKDEPGMSLTSADSGCTEEALVRASGKLLTRPFKT